MIHVSYFNIMVISPFKDDASGFTRSDSSKSSSSSIKSSSTGSSNFHTLVSFFANEMGILEPT